MRDYCCRRRHYRPASAMVFAAALALSVVASTSSARLFPHRWTDHLHGKLHIDGVDYLDFAVDDDVASIVLTFTHDADDKDKRNGKGDSSSSTATPSGGGGLELLLQFGSFPTKLIHDQKLQLTTTKPTSDLVVDHLRSGRYYLAVHGGAPYYSAPAFTGAHVERKYSLQIAYTSCTADQEDQALDDDGGGSELSDIKGHNICRSQAATTPVRAIAPPFLLASRTTQDDSTRVGMWNEYFKETSDIYQGCVDSQVPELGYTFTVPRPQWDLTLTLSTTFASGLTLSAMAQYNNFTSAVDDNNTGTFQSATIAPGAGFRLTELRFLAPMTGLWTVRITGNLTDGDNSTCATNGGISFAFKAFHNMSSCSQSKAESIISTTSDSSTVNDTPPATATTEQQQPAVDFCSLHFHQLEEIRPMDEDDNQELNAVFTTSQAVTLKPQPPTVAANSSHFAGVVAAAYHAAIGDVFAGANLQLKVQTHNISSSFFQVLVRVGGYPTKTQFDYQFQSSEAATATNITATASAGSMSNSSSRAEEDSNNNGTLDWQEFVWKPILYPKTGAWYLVVLLNDTRNTRSNSEEAMAMAGLVNVSLHTFACATQGQAEEDTCSGHGKCAINLSPRGKAYSVCFCEYGFSGERCDQVAVDRTYRGTQIFFTMVSNAAILPAAWLSWRRQLYAESVLFTATGLVSALYHACDFDLVCVLQYSDLHHLDFALSFNVIALVVVHLSGARSHVKVQNIMDGNYEAGLLVFYLLWMLVVTTSDNPNALLLWLILIGVFIIQFALAIAYYIAIGSARMGLGKYVALKSFCLHSKNFDGRYGLAGLVLLATALCCRFLASSSNYWIVHSTWHLSAMLATFCFLSLRLNDKYQLVAPGLGVDVLATPPQFRFAVSSIKSVDILEDTSENEQRFSWQ